MNATEIVAEVLRITKRPDKLQDAWREVNAAVTFFSTDSDFSRDIAELLLAISPQDYTLELPFTSLPRFRKIHYLRRSGTAEYLSALPKSQMFIKCAPADDRYYVVGSGFRLSMTKLAAGLDVGFYQYPPKLTNAAPEFWQLEGNWPAIIDRAAAKIFTNIGDDASAGRHEGYARTAYIAFRNTTMGQD